MPQFGRPSTDTYNADLWEEDDASTLDIWDQIDEAAVDDLDFIRTLVAPTADVYTTQLTSVEDPLSNVNHVVRFRAAKSAAGGAQIDLTVQLRQGYVSEVSQGTLIATAGTLTNISEIATTTTYTLSAGEADSITNYASLFLRFLGNQV